MSQVTQESQVIPWSRRLTNKSIHYVGYIVGRRPWTKDRIWLRCLAPATTVLPPRSAPRYPNIATWRYQGWRREIRWSLAPVDYYRPGKKRNMECAGFSYDQFSYNCMVLISMYYCRANLMQLRQVALIYHTCEAQQWFTKYIISECSCLKWEVGNNLDHDLQVLWWLTPPTLVSWPSASHFKHWIFCKQ